MVACWAHNPKVSGSKPLLARSENDLKLNTADVAQSVERKPFKLVAVGSSPTVGNFINNNLFYLLFITIIYDIFG